MTFKFDNGIEVTLRGTITTFSADNLAAWGVAGFKALGSAFRKCQYCMAVDEYLQTKVCKIKGCVNTFRDHVYR